MQQLPGGPDESPKIQALSARIAEAERQAAVLELQMTLRPVPSMYHELQQQISKFLSRSCDPADIRQMVEKLVRRLCFFLTFLLDNLQFVAATIMPAVVLPPKDLYF